MSRRAEQLVWERSRAKGSDLLVLLCIADCATHEGRNAWPSVRHLSDHARLSERGTRYVLHRLESQGEIEIEFNTARRVVDTGTRQFVPEWFLHVRAVCEWESYQTQGTHADFVSSVFQAGRKNRRLESAKFSDSAGPKNGKELADNRKKDVGEIGKKTSNNRKDAALHKGRIQELDPRTLILEQEQPAAAADDTPQIGTVFAGATLDPTHPADAFALSWNTCVTEPLKPIQTMTKQRRRLIRLRLLERPLEQWHGVFERVERSSFCRGQNSRGFIASLDWLIGSPDPAVKVLEGQYDDHVSETELTEAANWQFRVGRGAYCYHEPACEDRQHCLRETALTLRRRKAS